MADATTLYVYPLPESVGYGSGDDCDAYPNGALVLRELPHAVMRRIRKSTTGGSGRGDDGGIAYAMALQDALVAAAIAGVDHATAGILGIQGESDETTGCVLVTDAESARTVLYGRLSAKARECAAAYFDDCHSVAKDEIAPLLAARRVATR